MIALTDLEGKMKNKNHVKLDQSPTKIILTPNDNAIILKNVIAIFKAAFYIDSYVVKTAS